MVAAGTADTEEDIFTTQATTATAVAGVTIRIADPFWRLVLRASSRGCQADFGRTACKCAFSEVNAARSDCSRSICSAFSLT
jgi:hypothetical protein